MKIFLIIRTWLSIFWRNVNTSWNRKGDFFSMKSVINKILIWWRDVPIDVEWGLLDYLSEHWGNDIYIVCANDFDMDRKICSWDVQKKENIHFIIGELKSQYNKQKIEQLLEMDALHVFSGIKGGHKWCLDMLKKKFPKGHNSIIIMESPSLYGSKIKRRLKKLMYPIIYRYYNVKYGKMFNALLTIGKEAKDIYAFYGWPKDSIYPFMYLPRIECDIEEQNPECSKNIKALYIGRFEYDTKGVKILMDAIDNISINDGWHFDFVGGYGTQKDEVIEWCNNTNNINFCGSWSSDSVVKNMSKYDLCVVPSLYDGWNMAPFQTINAGIGCLISDRAGSYELIESSGAGKVFSVDDCGILKDILNEVISNPKMIGEWKKNAVLFREKINQEIVGDYFIQIIKYCFGEIEQKPSCPW